MATVTFSYDRGTPHYEIGQAAGSAITPDMELTVEDALSREEIVVGLTKMIQRVLETTWPTA